MDGNLAAAPTDETDLSSCICGLGALLDAEIMTAF